MIKIGCWKKDVELEIDEDLGTYFECVTPWESKRWIA
jgi:hypothetical protein